MAFYALLAFVISMVAAMFGFGGIAVEVASVAKYLFVAFFLVAMVGIARTGVRRPVV